MNEAIDLPQAIPILHAHGGLQFRPVKGLAINVDAGIRTGYDIPTHYDSLLLKLIAHGATREEARSRALRGLSDLVILHWMKVYVAE